MTTTLAAIGDPLEPEPGQEPAAPALASSTAKTAVHAEEAVLGRLLTDPELHPTVAKLLGPRDFGVPIHRRVYEAMSGLVTQGKAVDLVSIAAELGDWSLEELSNLKLT